VIESVTGATGAVVTGATSLDEGAGAIGGVGQAVIMAGLFGMCAAQIPIK